MVNVDTIMLDAPDLTEEPEDVSMVDVEMDNSVMDVDMADAPYEPLLCQGSPTPPAPPPFSNPVSAVLEGTATEVEQSRNLGVNMPVIVHQPSFIPIHPLASPFSSIPPAVVAVPTEVNAQVQPAGSGSHPPGASLLPINAPPSDAMVEPLTPTPKPEAALAPLQPQQQQAGPPVCGPIETSVLTPVSVSLPAPVPSHSFTPATATETINFAFQAPGPCKTRRTTKPRPRPRPRRIQAQAPAAAPANAPAPDPPQVPQLPVSPAPTTAPQSSSSTSDEGNGNASTTSAEAEPTRELDYAMIPGEIVRSHCED